MQARHIAMQKSLGLLHKMNLALDFSLHPLFRNPPNPENITPRKRFIVPWTGSEEKPALYRAV